MLETEETIVTDKDGVRAVIAAGADGQQFAPSGAGSQVRISNGSVSRSRAADTP